MMAAVACLAGQAGAAMPGLYFAGFYMDSSLAYASVDGSASGLDADVQGIWEGSGFNVDSWQSNIQDKTDIGYAFSVGFQFSQYLAAELGWVDMGTIHYEAAGAVSEGGSSYNSSTFVSAKTKGPLLAGIGIWTTQRPDPGAAVAREYTQITHFADAVTSPALSRDGRWLTFLRGASTFNGPGQIYVKALPDGEPIQLTADSLGKMDPFFSPDNSTIAYTTVRSQFVWDTWTVPVRGGEPRLWLRNASGLSWLRDGRLMFAEQTGGLQMRVTIADEQRNAARVLYSPSGEYVKLRGAISTHSPHPSQVLVT